MLPIIRDAQKFRLPKISSPLRFHFHVVWRSAYYHVLVMRGSGFFPTRGSRFYEIIWPAPHHCIYFYNPPRPAPATIK